MKMKFASLFLALAFCVGTIVGCGSGSGSGGTQPPPPPSSYTVSGTITGAPLGATVKMGTYSTTTDSTGNYSLTGVAAGIYTLTPTLAGYTFSPASVSVSVGGTDATITVTTAITATPVPNYTVTVITDAHVFASSATVQSGQTATITYTTDSGVSVVSATGCTISVAAQTCTTGVVTSNLSVHLLGGSSDGSSYVLNSMKLSPDTLFDDEFATTPVTLTVSTYGTIDHMLVQWFPSWFDKTIAPIGNGPGGLNALTLKDGGMNGGEHIWTLTFATGVTPALRFYSGTVDYLMLEVDAYDGSGNQLVPAGPSKGFNYVMNLGVVSRKLTVSTTQVAADAYAAPNMVNLVLPVGNDRFNQVTAKLADYYPDVFQIMVMQEVEATAGEYGNESLGIERNNQVAGIGLPLDSTPATLAGDNVCTPSDVLCAYMDNIVAHVYANYLDNPALPLAGEEDTVLSTNQPDPLSQYGGILIPQNGGGYIIGASNIQVNQFCSPYSPLTLYLMGLGPLNAIPTAAYLDPSYGGPWDVVIPESEVHHASGQDIVNVYGGRTPSYTNSSKTFPTIFVGVSTQPMTAAEVALRNRIAVYFASKEVDTAVNTQGIFPVCSAPSFSLATGGVGTMTTTVPSPK
ncbi:MAG: carboxypeptidase-like regulatory domain-containing protein [Candidatus Pacebacteria bacterium]|nr:carboxypeptidase-like regulatory domain-containing protein [Candidatus Paceibacterota bacterium]